MAYQEFNGVRFYLNSSTGYWERARGVPRKMHVYVWEFYFGKLPDGYCIHHKDGDKGNNDIENLQLMTFKEHASLHAQKSDHTAFVEKSRGWHKTDVAREVSRQNGYATSAEWPTRTYTCEYCGATFEVKSPRTDYRFCSNKCKSAWRRQSGVDDEHRTCVVCGGEFVVNKYSKTLCCSRKCSSAFRRNKKH